MSQAFAASQPSNFPPPYTLVLANLTPGCSEAVPRDRRVASLIIPFAIRAAGCGLQCTARPMAASRSGHKNPTNIQVSAACSIRKFKPIIMGPVASGCRRRQGLRPDHRPPRAAKTVICAMDADVFFFFFSAGCGIGPAQEGESRILSVFHLFFFIGIRTRTNRGSNWYPPTPKIKPRTLPESSGQTAPGRARTCPGTARPPHL